MRNKNPKGPSTSTLKSTSLSGFGEKKFYIENIPGGGGRFLFQGESFLYIKLSPGDEFNFYIEKLAWGKILYKENHPERMFLYRKPSGGTILCRGCFALWYLRGCCNDVDCFGGRPFPAVFRADFIGGMIPHLYSAIMIWGSRNINIVKFIFLTSMWVPTNAPTRYA